MGFPLPSSMGYVYLDPSAQSAIDVIGIGSLDPTLCLWFLTIGPWFLVAGWVSLRHGLLPQGLAYLGVIAGIAALFFVVLSFLEVQTLTMITGAMAVVFHPLWLIWTGLVLGRDFPMGQRMPFRRDFRLRKRIIFDKKYKESKRAFALLWFG